MVISTIFTHFCWTALQKDILYYFIFFPTNKNLPSSSWKSFYVYVFLSSSFFFTVVGRGYGYFQCGTIFTLCIHFFFPYKKQTLLCSTTFISISIVYILSFVCILIYTFLYYVWKKFNTRSYFLYFMLYFIYCNCIVLYCLLCLIEMSCFI